MNDPKGVAGIILAAGLSSRMGQSKMLLPWGSITILGTVINNIFLANISPITVVVGAEKEKITNWLNTFSIPTRAVYNPEFTNGLMLKSIQVAINNQDPSTKAVLVALGDQPQIKTEVVQDLASIYIKTKAKILIPSFKNRRGHPWIVDRILWPEILKLSEQQSMREFFSAHNESILHVPVNTSSVLADIDTPEDYQKSIREE